MSLQKQEITQAQATQLLTQTSSDSVLANATYLDAGGEQVIFEVLTANTERNFFRFIQIDCVNMTQNGTLKLYSKIDGTNYRLMVQFAITAGQGVQLSTERFPTDVDFRITWTEAGDEGADRVIPYHYQLAS